MRMINTRINLPGVKGAYVIATADASDELKKRADLTLPGVPEEDFKLVRNALSVLRQIKKEATDPITLEFIGGTITLPNEERLVIHHKELNNLRIQGNGVTIRGNYSNTHYYMSALVEVHNAYVKGINIENKGDGTGLGGHMCTLIDSNASSEGGSGIYTYSSKLINCTGTAKAYLNYGIIATGNLLEDFRERSLLIGCTGVNLSGSAIHASYSDLIGCEAVGDAYGFVLNDLNDYPQGSVIVVACTSSTANVSDIVFNTGQTMPSTEALMRELNQFRHIEEVV